MEQSTIENKLDQLTIMNIQDLKEEWRKYFDCDPPKYNRINLERRLAYRIQEEAFGGLREETRLMLDEIAQRILDKRNKRTCKPLKTGSIITKEYNGIEHRITIAQNGYEYDGRRYSNLSIIARLITGISVPGPDFFDIEGTK